jgi:hypothetical protein
MTIAVIFHLIFHLIYLRLEGSKFTPLTRVQNSSVVWRWNQSAGGLGPVRRTKAPGKKWE